MTYSSGSTITAADYNTFTNSVDAVWGVGSGENGYGQTNIIGETVVGSTISATQWATLLARTSSAASHQGTSITAITSPTAGDTISAYAALSTNITAIESGRNNAAASGSDSTAATTTTTAWVNTATTSKTITFASANQLRYFFNAGGMIRMSFSRSGGTASDQNTSWTNLLTACGTIVLTGAGDPGPNKTIAGTSYTGTTKIGGSGTADTLAEGIGAYDLTGTNQTLFKQFATTYTYTANFAQIQASISGSVITITATMDDQKTPGVPGGLDSVDGTLTMNTTIRPPSTTYIADTWGSVTQNSATWTLT